MLRRMADALRRNMPPHRSHGKVGRRGREAARRPAQGIAGRAVVEHQVVRQTRGPAAQPRVGPSGERHQRPRHWAWPAPRGARGHAATQHLAEGDALPARQVEGAGDADIGR